MRALCAMALAATAASQEPAREQEERRQDEKRIERLEEEVERLRLRSEESAEVLPVVPPPPPPNVLNPRTTVFGNGVYRWDDRPVRTEEGDRVDRRFLLREVEVDFRAAVDPFADGLVIVALEQEAQEEFHVGVEEGFVTVRRLPIPILDKPPLGLNFRIGRFRTETGRVNLLHTHDLPHTYRPLAVEEFLGEEGMVGQGASVRFFIPLPFDEDSALEFTAQALTGGSSNLTVGGEDAPGYVLNLRWFRSFGRAHSLDVAAIAHEGETTPGVDLVAWMYSGDVLYRWKPTRGGEFNSFVLGGQVFHARHRFVDQVIHRELPVGWFGFLQYQPWRTIYVGGRYDSTDRITDDEIQRRAASGYASWYPSEFLRFRAGYERRFSDLPEEDGRDSVFAEVNFVIGSHPPEPFWVNR